MNDKDIEAGEVFTKGNIKVIRPGYGLASKYYEQALGSKVKNGLKAGKPLELRDI